MLHESFHHLQEVPASLTT